MSAPVVQQAKAKSCKEELNRVETDVRNNQISDITAMTQRMQLESQLNDTKVAPVKYVEEVKPQIYQTAQSAADVDTIKPKNVMDVIGKFHQNTNYATAPSKHERSQVMANQLNQMAISNRILHGLF